MKPAGALRRLWLEHRVIERVLETIDLACQALRDGAPLDPRFFLDAVDFIRAFADGWHHAREEGQLVAVLDECGVGRTRLPIDEALDDHRAGRAHVALLAAAAARLGGGSRLAVGDVIGGATLYAELLRRHIDMEDRLLYPLATEALEPVARDELAARFKAEEQRLGRDTPRRYMELAHSLRARLDAATRKTPGRLLDPGSVSLAVSPTLKLQR